MLQKEKEKGVMQFKKWLVFSLI